MSIRAWLRLLNVVSVGGSCVVLGVVLLWSPDALGPFGVTLWFVGLFLVVSTLLANTLFWFKTYLQISESRLTRLRSSARQGLLLSSLLVVCLALSSLGQLSWLDAALFGTVLLIIEVYVRYRWPQD
jgi:type IV secretory pathway TrbD component